MRSGGKIFIRLIKTDRILETTNGRTGILHISKLG